MDKFVIESNGPLQGTVAVGGAKNASLPILAATLLTEDTSVIEGVPSVTDVVMMVEILRRLGVQVTHDGDRVEVQSDRYEGAQAPYELVRQMRASICVLGPLLAKQGRAQVSMPGGCVIGARPIDLHIKGLRALGASISVEHGYLVATAKQLRGARVHLSGAYGSSVLATGNVMMAATLADGVTTIEQAACEPEVVDLADCLVGMGARITGQGTPRIEIDGVARLHGSHYRVIPDRVEAGTLMMAAAITRGDVTIHGARPEHLGALIDKLVEAQVTVEKFGDALRVRAARSLRGVEVTTWPFPGFPTDLQAPMMALMAVSEGMSVLTERVYPERFMHISELNRMGARITREGASAVVKGVAQLSGAPVIAPDLRAAAALVLAGLRAENVTELRGVEHLDRGYEDFEGKLRGLGAKIRRVEGEPAPSVATEVGGH